MSDLLPQHERRLLSGLETLRELVEQMRNVALQGRTPVSTLPTLEPLPEEAWSSVDSALSGLLEAMETYASANLGRIGFGVLEWEGVNATFFWLEMLMRRIEETLRDLEPERMGKAYGPLPLRESEQLEEALDKAAKQVSAAAHALRIARDGCQLSRNG